MDCVYLDNNATTRLHPEVASAMAATLERHWGNPASQHAAGRRSRQLLEDARERIGQLLGLDMSGRQPDRVVFTSGGTEANNLALFGLGQPRSTGLIVSSLEHPSVLVAARHLAARGAAVVWLSADADGVARIESLAADLGRSATRLLSLMLANNETGVWQPVAEAVEIARQHAVPVHTDAVQVIGRIPVDFHQLGVSAMTVSAHKLHGPVGIGALLLRGGVPLEPQLFGGFQQWGLRPGTESVALVVGFRRALELWRQEADERAAKLGQLRDRLERLLRVGCPEVVIHGSRARRLPHTSNVAFPGVDRQVLLMALDLAGIACSAGSACASGSSEPSHVLLAMGLPKELVDASLRLSVSIFTEEAEVDWAARRICQIYRDLRRGADPGISATGPRQKGGKPL